MDLEPVQASYSSMSQAYIDLFDSSSGGHEVDAAFIRRHLAGLSGRVLDLGCGPGQWTGYLHSLGADVTGVDVVPEFIAHAQVAHAGPHFRLGSMTDVPVAEPRAAGLLAWYSTIHLPPPELDGVLVRFRELLVSSGTLVVGFFDSDDDVAAFDHKVVTAYRWPADALSARLAAAGLVEVERVRQQFADRPDRKYAAIAARAS